MAYKGEVVLLDGLSLTQMSQMSGQIVAYVRARRELHSPDDHFQVLMGLAQPKFGLASISARELVLGDKREIVVSRRFPCSYQDGYVKIPMMFRGVTTASELARLLEMATSESVVCDFSVAVREVGDMGRIEDICCKSRETYSVTPEGNFHAAVTLSGVRLEVYGYPRAGTLNIRGTYNKYLGDAAEAILSLLEDQGRSLQSRLREALGF